MYKKCFKIFNQKKEQFNLLKQTNLKLLFIQKIKY
jgi:hypothetical protein